MTTLDKIRADIKNQLFVGRILNSKDFDDGLKWCLELFDKYAEQEPISVSVSEKEPDEISEEVTLRFFRNSLKVRWQDMVIYNVEWLKKNWQMEMDIVCGVKPCDDAISRLAVLDGIEELKQSPWATDKRGNGFEYLITEALDMVADLCVKQEPPVRPQEKTGKWEEIVKEHKCYARDDTYTTTEYHCSECGEEPFVNEDGFYELSNYCPNCGAKMVEPTCDTCEYNTAAFMPCNACEDKSEYKQQESEVKNG